MAYNELTYRLSPVAPRTADAFQPAQKTPNRKSVAKKKWWAEKRERERLLKRSKDAE